ncbi:hypothetical protein [Amaricoccus tamworthensis]|uniref:hypothetical protein n=1 Tax=Amaricoccus tamworthensis TaxID=57002 RepID=UPI003C7E130C
MRSVLIKNDYPASATRLWALATDYDALRQVAQGNVEFDGLPHGRFQAGQKVSVMISLFGIFPKRPYNIEILECDETRMVLRTCEEGAGIKSWRHTVRITETGGKSLLTDQVDIDAGWLTGLAAMLARHIYRTRHKPRLKLIESGVY